MVVNVVAFEYQLCEKARLYLLLMMVLTWFRRKNGGSMARSCRKGKPMAVVVAVVDSTDDSCRHNETCMKYG